MPYREPGQSIKPQSFCIPSKDKSEVIFFDHICGVRVENSHSNGAYLAVQLANSETRRFRFETWDLAKSAMRELVDGKVEWDEYKLLLPVRVADELRRLNIDKNDEPDTLGM